MVHKNRFHKTALANVVIDAQAVVQVSAVRHLLAVVSRRACSSRLAAAEMGTYSECRRAVIHSNAFASCREECRFPHVMADGHVMGRGGRFRSPPQNPINGNNQANFEEKLANLSITEVSHTSCSGAFLRDTLILFVSHVVVERQSRARSGKQR